MILFQDIMELFVTESVSEIYFQMIDQVFKEHNTMDIFRHKDKGHYGGLIYTRAPVLLQNVFKRDVWVVSFVLIL